MASSVIIKNPEILGGVPVFVNTRVPFQALLDYLEGGQTLDEFLDDFPRSLVRLLSLFLNRPKRLSSPIWNESSAALKSIKPGDVLYVGAGA